jgi:hypothetical protein
MFMKSKRISWVWVSTAAILALGSMPTISNEKIPVQLKDKAMTQSTDHKQPIDFYAIIHKGLRREMFKLAVDMGSTDFKNKPKVVPLMHQIQYLISILRHHGEHEDKYFHPFIQTKTPEALELIDNDHQILEKSVQQIEALSQSILQAKSDDIRVTLGNNLYQIFNLFVADYLHHLHAEEENMPLIQKRSTPQELEKVISDFQAAADPQVLEDSLAYIFPAIPQNDRESLLNDIKQKAPVDVYQRVLKIYNSCGATRN